MAKRSCVLICMALVAVSAGCAVYSQQNYGPQAMGSIGSYEECLKKAGAPDLIHKADGRTVFLYRSIDAMEVLGIFGQVQKRDRVIVFDATGKVVSDDIVDKGKGIAIIGAMSPAMEIE